MLKRTSYRLMLGLAAVILGVLSQASHAQIGSGWTGYTDTHFIDYTVNGSHKHHDDKSFSDGGVVYTNQNGIRTCKLVNNTSNRVEVRSDEHYTSGKRQMQGDLRIHNLSSQTVNQIFHGSKGPVVMVAGYGSKGGELRKYSGHITLITGINNTYVRYNCLHQVNSYIRIYINGSKKFDGGGAPNDGAGNNNKYGLYGTKQTPDPTVDWKNVKFFK